MAPQRDDDRWSVPADDGEGADESLDEADRRAHVVEREPALDATARQFVDREPRGGNE